MKIKTSILISIFFSVFNFCSTDKAPFKSQADGIGETIENEIINPPAIQVGSPGQLGNSGMHPDWSPGCDKIAFTTIKGLFVIDVKIQ